MNEEIFLISEAMIPDERGDPVIARTERAVFCDVASIGLKEFYQAAQAGLLPEIKFIIADYLDYGNEKELRYGDTVYRILRTYRTLQKLEIICTTEVI